MVFQAHALEAPDASAETARDVWRRRKALGATALADVGFRVGDGAADDRR